MLWGNVSTNAAMKPSYYANTYEVYGVNAASIASAPGCTTGWIVERKFLPGVVLTITAGGTGYANGDHLVFTPAANVGNTIANSTVFSAASGSVVTNANGAITSIVLFKMGQYAQTPTVSVTSATGSNASITAVLSSNGRSNRKTYETLVCVPSMDGQLEDAGLAYPLTDSVGTDPHGSAQLFTANNTANTDPNGYVTQSVVSEV